MSLFVFIAHIVFVAGIFAAGYMVGLKNAYSKITRSIIEKKDSAE